MKHESAFFEDGLFRGTSMSNISSQFAIRFASQFVSKLSLLASVAAWVILLGACTGQIAEIDEPREPSLLKLSENKIDGCAEERISSFELQFSEVVHLEKGELPKGLYLASGAEFLVEKRASNGDVVARMIAREEATAGRGRAGSEIVCTDHVDHFGVDFEMAITGLVKFDTSLDPLGGGLVARQFYAFANEDQHGVILVNAAAGLRSESLADFLRNGSAEGEIRKLSEGRYVLRFTKRRGDHYAKMLVHLERFSNEFNP
jgi:hypothetical protein